MQVIYLRFWKDLLFCICHHHSIVTTGLSQLVTMDGLHTVCLLVAGFCRWSLFFSLIIALSLFLAVFMLSIETHLSSHSSFSLSIFLSLHSDSVLQNLLHYWPSIHLVQTNTDLSFLSPFFSKLQYWKWDWFISWIEKNIGIFCFMKLDVFEWHLGKNILYIAVSKNRK